MRWLLRSRDHETTTQQCNALTRVYIMLLRFFGFAFLLQRNDFECLLRALPTLSSSFDKNSNKKAVSYQKWLCLCTKLMRFILLIYICKYISPCRSFVLLRSSQSNARHWWKRKNKDKTGRIGHEGNDVRFDIFDIIQYANWQARWHKEMEDIEYNCQHKALRGSTQYNIFHCISFSYFHWNETL